MRGAARARDDHLDAARFGAARELCHPYRRPVRGDDVLLECDAELLQRGHGVLHRLPIGGGAHDDGDEWMRRGRGHQETEILPPFGGSVPCGKRDEPEGGISSIGTGIRVFGYGVVHLVYRGMYPLVLEQLIERRP